MLAELLEKRRMTPGANKNYDTKDFIQELHNLKVTPHVAKNQNARRRSAIDGRTTRNPGYQISQKKRKRVEEIFAWLKTVGGMRKQRHQGLPTVGVAPCLLPAEAYNMVLGHDPLIG